MPSLAPHALIVGCGYLGRTLAAKLHDRQLTVFGTTRSPDHARQLAAIGVRPMLVHVTQPVTHAAMRPALEVEALDVYYMVPPGRPDSSPSPRQVVLGGIAHMVRSLKRAKVRRAVLVSSTAVYSQRGGQRVDADSPAKPHDERGRRLLEGEKLWLDAGEPYHVLRLAGLYGPGRVVGFKAVADGAPLLGDPEALINLIHVDDAAELLIAMMLSDETGRIELGCDGTPVPRIEYYRHLAQRLGAPPPQVLSDEKMIALMGLSAPRLRQTSSKALDHIATCRRTCWSPRYPNYRLGLEAVLNSLPR